MNSFVGKPEAERAVTTAEGPGMGTTGIFLSAHSLAYILKNISDAYFSIDKMWDRKPENLITALSANI